MSADRSGQARRIDISDGVAVRVCIFVVGGGSRTIPREGVEAVEPAVGRVVEPRSEVLLLGLGVPGFAAVAEGGETRRCGQDLAGRVVQRD